MSKVVQRAFFGSLQGEDSENRASEDTTDDLFLDFVQRQKYKENSFDIGEFFQTLPVKEHPRLWGLTRERTTAVTLVEDFSAHALDMVEGLTKMCTSYVEYLSGKNKKKMSSPAGLYETVQLLHDVIFTIDNSKLQNKISMLCELWWKNDLPNKENLAPQTITYLLFRSHDTSGSKADVERVFRLREALNLLDFDDESIDTVKHLLLRCMISPLYLRSGEGRRFLSFLFSCHLPFVAQLHLVVKNQIPSCSMSLLGHYGDVYFRAWRVAEGQVLIKIEYDCLQDLMQCGVYASARRTAKAVRRVLNVFHVNKRQKGVDEMLHRLYTPILWRAMKVANPVVRRNAASLFIEAFPLTNPEDSQEDMDAVLQKQFDQLQALMTDNDVEVRTLGVSGVCRVLGVYWEMIPPATTKSLLLKLLQDMTFDSTASAVRSAVLKGLTFVLENHLSHSTLKVFLPPLAPVIHDRSPKVQLAFLDLLLFVKKMRSIRFFDIVSVEQLLLRLEHSCPAVSVKLTELLINSYFPYTKALSEQVKRGLALLRRQPMAGKLFFANVHHHVPPEAIYQLINGFHKYLLKAAEGNDDAADDEDVDNSSKKNKRKRQADKTESLWARNQMLVENTLCTMAQLWHNTRQHNPTCDQDQTLEAALSKSALETLLEAYPSELAKVAIFTIAGNLPASCSPAFVDQSVPQLAALTASAAVSEYGPLLECLFSWGRQSEVLSLISSSLQQGLGMASKGRKKAAQTDPRTAALFLQYLLENHRTRGWLVGQAISPEGDVARLLSILSAAQIKLENVLSNKKEEVDKKFLFSVATVHWKLLMHCHALSLAADESAEEDDAPVRQKTDFLAAMLKFADFNAKVVLPELVVSAEEQKSGEGEEPPAKRASRSQKATQDAQQQNQNDQAELTHQVLVFFGKLCTEVITLGFDNQQAVAGRMVQWMGALKSKASKECSFITDMVSVFYKACYQMAKQMTTLPTDLMVGLPKETSRENFRAFFRALVAMTPVIFVEASLNNAPGVARSTLTEVIRSVKNNKSALKAVVELFVECVPLPSADEDEKTIDTFESLPSSAQLVLDVMSRFPQIVAVLPTMSKAVRSDSRAVVRMLSVVSAVNTLAHTHAKNAKSRETLQTTLMAAVVSLSSDEVNVEDVDEKDQTEEGQNDEEFTRKLNKVMSGIKNNLTV
mmetsp:Transcript_50826/g.99634  ORF Transcript_50826/g.99634 Transcript_50826/m.99634 type:complete len:1179 (-) Transcript_50826:273-3809(-)|eukprot:CAMPEP_0175139152 /NCGR_PEP_ID=MMETSP0087-20121206/10741_1 /TAXON_ID=136419 /ORGANISM="Unknown Unknown, Strain D1" /LENGTH=1178 /DNA_ID=CAMNT_0016422125 /DNA_START=31 /DNA_END=3567 /DNA_ORIENTATION=-